MYIDCIVIHAIMEVLKNFKWGLNSQQMTDNIYWNTNCQISHYIYAKIFLLCLFYFKIPIWISVRKGAEALHQSVVISESYFSYWVCSSRKKIEISILLEKDILFSFVIKLS